MKKETKKAPTIRFRGFNDDWEQRKLEDFGRATGGTSIESEFNKEGKYKVISIGSYSENSTYTDQGIRCNLTEKTQNRILNKNDLTMILNDKTAVGRIIGRVLLIEQDNSYVYNQRTERIEPNKNKYDPLFLYEMLNAPGIRSKIVRQCQGNTQIYVNWPVIANQKYKIPELKEQKIIGFFLKDLDHLITLHQRKLDQLKKLKKYFLQNMFPAKGEKVPRIRFKGFTGDWEQRKIADVAEIITGGTPSTRIVEYWNPPEVPWLSSGEVHKKYITSTDTMISRKGYENSSATMVRENSVLIALAGQGKTRGTVAINRIPLSTNQSIAAMTFPDDIDPDYVFSNLENRYEELRSISSGDGSRGGLNKKLVGDVTIPCPTLLEQNAIGTLFRVLNELITLHQRKLNQLKMMKKFMLQNLFI